MSEFSGHISQIIGPVVDVFFKADEKGELRLPSINDALSIKRQNGLITVQSIIKIILIILRIKLKS